MIRVRTRGACQLGMAWPEHWAREELALGSFMSVIDSKIL